MLADRACELFLEFKFILEKVTLTYIKSSHFGFIVGQHRIEPINQLC